MSNTTPYSTEAYVSHKNIHKQIDALNEQLEHTQTKTPKTLPKKDPSIYPATQRDRGETSEEE